MSEEQLVNKRTGEPLSADALRKRKAREREKELKALEELDGPEYRQQKWLAEHKDKWTANRSKLTKAEEKILQEQTEEWEYQHRSMVDVILHVKNQEAYGTGYVHPDLIFIELEEYRKTHPVGPVVGDLSEPENHKALQEIGPNMVKFGLKIDRLDPVIYRNFCEAIARWIYDHVSDVQFATENEILWKEVLELAEKTPSHYLSNWRGTVRAHIYWREDLEKRLEASRNQSITWAHDDVKLQEALKRQELIRGLSQ